MTTLAKKVLVKIMVKRALFKKFSNMRKGQLFALRSSLQKQAIVNKKVWRELEVLGEYISSKEIYSH